MEAILILGIVAFLLVVYNKCPFMDDSTVWSSNQIVKAIEWKEGNYHPSIGCCGHPKTRPIPRLIVQTNEKDYVPEGMAKATNTILGTNPEYEYIYFDDQKARMYIERYYPQEVLEAYDELIPGAYKADLFRYCFLNKVGGVYIDMGMVSLTKLDHIIRDQDIFIAPEDNGSGGIYNAFMASAPNNPILSLAIEMVVNNVKRKDYTDSNLGVTGPMLLGRAFQYVTGKIPVPGYDKDGVRIINFSKVLPCESGVVKDGGMSILYTRYPGYRNDQKWYNTNKHYSLLWSSKQVFK